MSRELSTRLGRVRIGGLVLGVLAAVALVIGQRFDRSQFFFSYLFAWLFWAGLSFGCFIIAMMHQLTGGRWGYPTRRIFEAGFLGMPVMLFLFIPLLFGTAELYPWARPALAMHDPVLSHRHWYQNFWGFLLRMGISLLVWSVMAACLRKWSREQDVTMDAAPTRKARALSGPGIVVFCLLGTICCIDWVMSLERQWYSTIFAVIIIIGQILAAFALSAALLGCFRHQEPFASVLNKTHFHHLGNLLLAFVIFWTYVSFAQLLIVYSGDLPHEIEWYRHRIAGNWKFLISALALFHFFIPFFLLLFRALKRDARTLPAIGVLIFAGHLVANYWLVMPSLHHEGIVVSWMDFASVIGIGGIWTFFFLARLEGAPLLPQQDPGMQFAFTYGR